MDEPVKTARPRGRPAGGTIKVTAAAVALLPETGSGSEFARVLSVTAATIQRWVVVEGAPAERKAVARWVLHKDSFSEWLTIKGKINESLGDHQQRPD